ncbi:hypothetical protein CAEBREN_19585 [Caenorhabditis brenneri]|uniref:Uncharacterized protein n=1 Tax=Caenorhabditis brenneri TaxID=135651 RepID=G0M940_CAEBE|nr:hypothetical protein CAEBREN_19585 [Caenorhabditis brenneri]
MSCSTTSIVFLALIYIVSGQQLMRLNSFNGNDAHNPLNVPAPYSIYVSANDDYHDDIYKNMFIVSKTESMSLYGLKTRKLNQNVGGLERYVINDAAYLTTSLSNDQLSKLHGVMYLSSPEQVANKEPLINSTTPSQTTTPTTVITTPKTPESTTKSSEKTNGLAALVLMAALRFL